jgi:hypothetical protein
MCPNCRALLGRHGRIDDVIGWHSLHRLTVLALTMIQDLVCASLWMPYEIRYYSFNQADPQELARKQAHWDPTDSPTPALQITPVGNRH